MLNNVTIEHFVANDELKEFIRDQVLYIKNHTHENIGLYFFIKCENDRRFKTIININLWNHSFSSHATGKTPFNSLSECRHKIMTQIRRKKKKILEQDKSRSLSKLPMSLHS